MSQARKKEEFSLVPEIRSRLSRDEGNLLPIGGMDTDTAQQIITKSGADLLIEQAMARKSEEAIRLIRHLYDTGQSAVTEQFNIWRDKYDQMEPGAKQEFAGQMTTEFTEAMVDDILRTAHGGSRQINWYAMREISVQEKREERRSLLERLFDVK